MAVRFDAANEYLVRTSDLPSMNLFGITGWVYLVTDRDAVSVLCALTDAGGNGVQLLTTSNGTTLRVYSSASETAGSDLPVGSWAHLALTKSGSAIKLYVNGTLDISRTDSINVTPAYLLIGGTSNWINARYGQWRVWDAELTQSEIVAEMRSTSPVRTSDLNGAYAFTSSTTADSSGNGRNLTAAGTLSLETPEPPVFGVLDVTLVGATLSAAGTVSGGGSGVTGSLAVTLEAATLTAAAINPITGAASVTLGAAALSAAGVNPITGALAQTLAPAAAAGTGVNPARGQAGITLAAATLSAAGTVTSPETITGTLTVTLASAALTAAGVNPVRGSLAATLANATLTAAGVNPVRGVLTVTLAPAALAATAVNPVQGAVAATLAPASLAASGEVTALDTITGALAVTLAPAALQAAGVNPVRGQAAIVLAAATVTATGTNPVMGSLAVTLAAAVLAAMGGEVVYTPTPAQRIFAVALERRVCLIYAEERTLEIDAEARLYQVRR